MTRETSLSDPSSHGRRRPQAQNSIVRHERGYRWSGVQPEAYKSGPDNFHGVVRQVLAEPSDGAPATSFVTRYFEIEPGGYTSLEQHQHAHVVILLRGRARIILDDRVHSAEPHDLVYIAPWCLHQLHAAVQPGQTDEPMGFLCIVDRERDAPVYPSRAEIERLCRNPDVAALLRV